MNDLEQIMDALIGARDWIDLHNQHKDDCNVNPNHDVDIAITTLDRMIETPAPTEKVERIVGIQDVIDNYEAVIIATSDEKHDAYVLFRNHAGKILEVFRAYLKLQSGENEKVDVESLLIGQPKSGSSDKEWGYYDGYNQAVRDLSNTGRLR